MSKLHNEVIATINRTLRNKQNENDVGGSVDPKIGDLEGAFANTMEHFIIATCCLGTIAIAFFTVIGIAKKKVSSYTEIHSTAKIRRWPKELAFFRLRTLVVRFTNNISKIHSDTFLTDHMIDQLPVIHMILKSRDNHPGHQAIQGIQKVHFYAHFT